MEVTSIITTNRDLESQFIEFIGSKSNLTLLKTDEDTYYYLNKITNRLDLYIHTKVSVKEEFSYNFSEEEVSIITSFFNNKTLFMTDISFRRRENTKSLITQFLSEQLFHHIISNKCVLIHDPFDGLLEFSNERLALLKKEDD